MNRIIPLALLTLSAPLFAMNGDPHFSFEPLVLGSPLLLTQADLAIDAPSAIAGILTGIDSIDAPAGSPGEPGRAILYPSDVLLAPVSFTPGAGLPAAIPFSGAAPSFQRWLASDDAQAIVPQLHLPAEPPSLLADDDSNPIQDVAPYAIGIAGLGLFSLALRRSGRTTPHRATPHAVANHGRARHGSMARPLY
ncbi:MAG: hypothetical protein IPJ98_03585 [Bryobacterales bacterium]|nr:hypothetical protein [Bryobacterales bacterium]